MDYKLHQRLYYDIINGYSKYNSSLGIIYIKHPNIIDYSLSEEVRADAFNRAKEEGLPESKDKEKILLEQDLWTESKNKEISELGSFINNMKTSKSKCAIPSQRESFDRQINENQIKLNNLLQEKHELLGMTAELFGSKKMNEYNIYALSYKDIGIKEKMFSLENFEDLDNKQINELYDILIKFSETFSFDTIKRLALLPIFLNAYYLCEDNPYIFWGKAIINLTNNQIDLTSHGKSFKSIISQHGNNIPSEILNDPEKLIDWHESRKNTKEIVDKQGDSGNIAIMGANKEDYQKMGLGVEHQRGSKIFDEAKKHGGKLNLQQLMKIQGA